MCLEHGVLEAVCTKCNTKLAAVFIAKGDWCAEHGFPESFCPTCHPERGGRPGTDVSGEEAPANGLRIVFRDSTVAERVGIEIARAREVGSESLFEVTATLVADNTRSARIGVRAPGVIERFEVDVGAEVREGTPLARIVSAAVAEARARSCAAEAELSRADANHARELALLEKGITSAKEVAAAKRALDDARAADAGARAALRMLGVDAECEGDQTNLGEFFLRSPIAGVVTDRRFAAGTLVDPSEPILEVIDSSVLWIDLDVPESLASSVAEGSRITVTPATGSETLEGTIRYVAPVIDPRTRTVRARASLPNPDGRLRANAYVRARIGSALPDSAVLVPRSAVQDAKGARVVFVPVSDLEFVTRRVEVGPAAGDLVAVVDGLAAGEAVVTTGSFLLKTETLKGSIGAGCCEVEPLR